MLDETRTTHSLTLGAAKVTIISDGDLQLPIQMFAGLPDGAKAALPPALTVGANIWLIEIGARKILVDTGSGDNLKRRFPRSGESLAILRNLTVTDVVLTHLHPDHIGGLKGDNPFPGAAIHVSDAEWGFWTTPGLADNVPPENKDTVLLVQSIAAPLDSRVTRHRGETGLGDGLTLVPLPGHTPGHSGLRISSEGKTLFIIADTVIAEDIHFAEPGVGYALDHDVGVAAQTRSATLAKLVADGTRIAATHLPFPGTGRVRAKGDAFTFEAD